MHESPWLILIPLILLGLGSLFIGFLFKDLFIGLGSDFWGGYTISRYDSVHIVDSEFLPGGVKFVPLIFTGIGLGLGLVFYNRYFVGFRVFWRYILRIMSIELLQKYILIYRKFLGFLMKKWYFDQLYNFFFVDPLLRFSYIVGFKNLDQGLLTMLGPVGITRILSNLIVGISKIQSGFIYHYFFLLIINFSLLFFFSMFFTIQFFFLFVLIILYYNNVIFIYR